MEIETRSDGLPFEISFTDTNQAAAVLEAFALWCRHYWTSTCVDPDLTPEMRTGWNAAIESLRTAAEHMIGAQP